MKFIYFFGIFYDLEKYFGSCGSFYIFEPIKGNYESSIPDEYLLKSYAYNLFQEFMKSNKEINILFIIMY